MFCLLCHEKIPRLRYWRTKSEFCCDDHAEIYKKQTLERLLTDQSASSQDGAPIMLGALSHETLALEQASHEAESAGSLGVSDVLESSAASFDRPSKDSVVEPAPWREEPQEVEGDDLRELWRLAEEVDASPSEIPLPVSSFASDWQAAPLSAAESKPGGSVREQTAEEALEALRQLAQKAGRGTALGEERRPEFVAEPDLRDELPPLSDFEDLLDELPIEAGDADFPPLLTPAELDASAETHHTVESSDEELPSVFERLTEASEVAAARVETWQAPSDFGDQDGGLGELIDDAIAACETPAPAAEAREPQPEIPVAADQMQEILESPEVLEVAAVAEDIVPETAVKDKVVAFPSPDAARQLRDKKEEKKEIERPHAAAPDKEERPAAPIARKGVGRADAPGARKLALKPLLAMWGVEPSPFEPAERDLAAMLERARAAAQTLAKADGIVAMKESLAFPGLDRFAPAESALAPRLGLYRRHPAIRDAAEDQETSFASPARDPHFEQPCRHPSPLFGANAFREEQDRGIRKIHARICDLIPGLAAFDTSEMRLHGCDSLEPVLDRRVPTLGAWESTRASDRSARIGRFLETACLIFPEIQESFAAGGSQEPFSADLAGRLSGVMDPAFDIERPGGRELGDIV